MTELVEFDLDGGGTVLVAVDGEAGVARASRLDRIARQTRQSFDGAIATVRDAASAALSQFQSMPRCPDEVEIAFGVQLTADAGAVIARTGVQGQLQVVVRWHRDPAGGVAP
ncbi:MAG TPA: CU044_2847 family protein [Pilimelia sp.]|nr:CU044_2847 family protein [Pilimelia sp.]